mmetsp:Transcript_10810/g.24898  ORF Transcript_10810/g.24898 Transcript_10810/m.24898 type:complete len:210 (+) Transcript_10810:359-988(+)
MTSPPPSCNSSGGSLLTGFSRPGNWLSRRKRSSAGKRGLLGSSNIRTNTSRSLARMDKLSQCQCEEIPVRSLWKKLLQMRMLLQRQSNQGRQTRGWGPARQLTMWARRLARQQNKTHALRLMTPMKMSQPLPRLLVGMIIRLARRATSLHLLAQSERVRVQSGPERLQMYVRACTLHTLHQQRVLRWRALPLQAQVGLLRGGVHPPSQC